MFSLDRIKEISPQKRMQLINHGITTVEELAMLYPRSYYDFRKITFIKNLQYGQMAVVYGRVVSFSVGPKSNSIIICDGDNNRMTITWFGSDYVFRQFQARDEAYFCGRVTDYRLSWTMVNPLFATKSANEALRIYPVYPKFKGMSEKYMKDSIHLAISFLDANRKDFAKDLFARQIGMVEYIQFLVS